MNCILFEEYMMKYFDGCFDDMGLNRMKDHMSQCPQCKSSFESMAEALEAVRSCETVEPPADFEAGVMKKVAELEACDKKHSDRFLTVMYIIAGFMLLSMSLMLLTGLRELAAIKPLIQSLLTVKSVSDGLAALYGMIKSALGSGIGSLGVMLYAAAFIIKIYYVVVITVALTAVMVYKLYVNSAGGNESRQKS